MLGMEGGGTSTVTTLFSPDGLRLAETRRAPTNPWLYGGLAAVADLILGHIDVREITRPNGWPGHRFL